MGEGVEGISRRLDRKTGLLGQKPYGQLTVAPGRSEPGSDHGRAERHGLQRVERRPQVRRRSPEGVRLCAVRLSDRERQRIPQARPAEPRQVSDVGRPGLERCPRCASPASVPAPASTTAIASAVGYTSFVDCDRFTWSFGWTGS